MKIMPSKTETPAEDCPAHCLSAKRGESCSTEHGWDAPVKLTPAEAAAVQNHRAQWTHG